MAKIATPRAIKLYGTEQPVGKKRMLMAGPITAVLDNGAIRTIRIHGAEVLRGISFLVRDKDWGTTAAAIDNLKVRQGKAGFTVTYTATCRDVTQAIRYDATIEATAKGTLKFSALATPLTDVVTNRTGFVVLHPLVGVVGTPVGIVHTTGKKERGRFPKFVSPGQPVFDIRSLKHTVVPGVTATVLMQGNKFEMEDHRNWMDASYKTYVCSLLDPWPYTLKQGEAFEQSISVMIEGKPADKSARGAKRVTVALGGAKGKMPLIGAAVPMGEADASLAASDAIMRAAPSHLVCQIDGREQGGAKAAAAFHALSVKTGKPVTLEIILPAKDSADEEVAAIAREVAAGGLKPTAVVVSHVHDLKSFQPETPRPWGPTYEEMALAVRKHFSGVAVGGGMLSYFTELNRKPVAKGVFDFVTHTVCPIVHAADDVSVMETLESMPSIIASTRNMIGKTPYHLGPSGISARDNPYGAAVAANPDNARVCLSDRDPRQRGLFAAAWNVGLVAAAARGGLDAIALGALTGPQGVIDGERLRPAYHVLAGLAPASGLKRIETQSSATSAVEAVAFQGKQGPVLWLANLTTDQQDVKVTGFAGRAVISILDERSFAALTAKPDFLAQGGTMHKSVTTLQLGPYAVVRIEASAGG